jgi:hypothetical protein
MLLGPGVVRGHVVRDEIEHEPQAPRPEPLAESGQRGIAAQAGVDRVSGDRKSGAGDVLLAEVRQRLLEFPAPFVVRSRYEITWPLVVISLRLLMPFRNFSGPVIL